MSKKNKKELTETPAAGTVGASLLSIIERTDETTGELKEYAVINLHPANQGLNNAMMYLDVSYLENHNEHELNRIMAYNDYDDMEETIPEVKVALDIYADVACMGDKGDDKAFVIKTKNEKIKEIVDGLTKRLDLHSLLWTIAREIRKYGDVFEEVIVDPVKKEITELKNLTVYSMFRNENKSGKLINFIQRDFQGKDIAKLKPEQVIHLRNEKPRNLVPNDVERNKYGKSILYPLRRLYILLLNMEDGIVVGRLYRSHQRYKITVDVTGLTFNEAKKKIKEYKNQFRRKRITDASGRAVPNKFREILDPQEDFFIGARKDGVTPDVGVVQGQTGLSDVADVQYFQNKLFAVLKIPKAFMAYETDINAKATLAKQDVSFGRTVRRLQSFLASFVRQLIDMELNLKDIDPNKEENGYQILFAEVSMEDEQIKSEVFSIKVEAATMAKDAGFVSKKYAATKILGIPEEEYDAMLSDIEAEKPKEPEKEITPKIPEEKSIVLKKKEKKIKR